MKNTLISCLAVIMLTACGSQEQKSTQSSSSFPLEVYVNTPDSAFRYEIIESVRGANWTEYRIRMVSGTWLTGMEVDEPEWWHWLTMVVPDELQETESLMLIGGGSRGDTLPITAPQEMINVALATGSVVSHLSNVPFQPIDYKGDTMGGVFEDDLIAFAWLQFLEGGATEDVQTWLPRFPMTRAVVRASRSLVIMGGWRHGGAQV